MLAVLIPWLVVGLGVLRTAPPPSLAVVTLTAEQGVAESTTRLLTDVLLQELHGTHAFSRVVSARELESVLGLEKQRQLMTCADGSCLAEVADALGVDLLLTGAIGRVGDTLLLSLRLMDARSGTVRATRSIQLAKGSEAALITVIRPTLQQLLTDAGMHFTPAAAQPPTRAPLLLAAGLAGGAGAGAGVLLGTLALLAGVGGVLLPKVLYVPTPGLGWQQRLLLMPGAGLAGSGFGVVLVTLGLLLGVGGLGLVMAHAATG